MKQHRYLSSQPVLVFPRAHPQQLAAFDSRTKACTMNCGPHRDDPRTKRERKFLCDDCLFVDPQSGVSKWPPTAETGESVMCEPFNKETASTRDKVAWVLCQIIDDDAPMRWTRYRFAAGCIAGNKELMADLKALGEQREGGVPA